MPVSLSSARLALPYIAPAQAQKHVTHNEALRVLDHLVQLTLATLDQTAPPPAPLPGEMHAVGTGATGDWAGQDGMIAISEDGGWIFRAPGDGWLATVTGSDTPYIFRAGTWQEVSWPADNLDHIGIGTTADGTNRLAVAADATLLSHDGAGHQLKINKALAADTASLLFQTGWSGRAEMGLAGDDDFSIKTSADGSAWTAALTISAGSGEVQMGQARITDVLRLPPRATPASPAAGDIYFDSTSNTLRCYDGTAWRDLF